MKPPSTSTPGRIEAELDRQVKMAAPTAGFDILLTADRPGSLQQSSLLTGIARGHCDFSEGRFDVAAAADDLAVAAEFFHRLD